MVARAMALAEREGLRATLRATLCRGREKQLQQPVRTRPSRHASESKEAERWRALANEFGVHVDEVELCTDESDRNGQAWTPAVFVKPSDDAGRDGKACARPCVVLLHATGGDRGQLARHAAQYASRGYVAVSVDSRHHGSRASDAYNEALLRSWRTADARPFLFDTVYDLMRLLDYLQQQAEVDLERVGVTGVSLGGMHAWLWAAADERVRCAAPMIGVQSFAWAVEHDRWQARAESLRRGNAPSVFDVATKDLGKTTCDAAVVEEVWNRIAPGLLTHADAPQSLPLIAPRPLLVLNGELDPRCPIAGLEAALERTKEAYASLGAPDMFEISIQAGIGHKATMEMHKAAAAFLDRHLLSGQVSNPATTI